MPVVVVECHHWVCLPAGVNRIHSVDTRTNNAVHWEDGVEETRMAEMSSCVEVLVWTEQKGVDCPAIAVEKSEVSGFQAVLMSVLSSFEAPLSLSWWPLFSLSTRLGTCLKVEVQFNWLGLASRQAMLA